MSDHDRNGNRFFSGLAFGVALGAGILYFLTSTDKGKKIKREIEEKSEDVIHDLTELIEDIEEKGNEFKAKALAIKEEIKERAEEVEETIIEKTEQHKQPPKVFTKNGKPLSK